MVWRKESGGKRLLYILKRNLKYLTKATCGLCLDADPNKATVKKSFRQLEKSEYKLGINGTESG